VLSLLLAALFFTGIHLGIAGTVIRDRAIGILGKNGYMAAFAVASVIGLAWLVAAYNRAPIPGERSWNGEAERRPGDTLRTIAPKGRFVLIWKQPLRYFPEIVNMAQTAY
jgi:hypothetical protein